MWDRPVPIGGRWYLLNMGRDAHPSVGRFAEGGCLFERKADIRSREQTWVLESPHGKSFLL